MEYIDSLFFVAKCDYDKNYGTKKHKHNYFQIVYIISGEVEYTVNNQKYILKSSDCILIKPKSFHQMQNLGKEGVLTIELKFSLASVNCMGEFKHNDCLVIKEDGMILKHVESIRESAIENIKYSAEIAKTYLQLLLLNILNKHEAHPNKALIRDDIISTATPNPICTSIKEFIIQNYNKQVSLDDISNYIKYNKNYICFIFKKTYGITIFNYLYKLRMYHAKNLLCFSEYTLKQICDKVGCKSVYHFSRKFKEEFCVSPSRYRNIEKNEFDKYYISVDGKARQEFFKDKHRILEQRPYYE